MDNNNNDLFGSGWNSYMSDLTGREQGVNITQNSAPQTANTSQTPQQTAGEANSAYTQAQQEGKTAQDAHQTPQWGNVNPTQPGNYERPFEYASQINPPEPNERAARKEAARKEKPKKEKKPHPIRRAIAAGLVFGLVGGATFTGVQYAGTRFLGTGAAPAQEQAAQAPQMNSTTEALEQIPATQAVQPEKKEAETAIPAGLTTGVSSGRTYTVSQIAEMCMPSVVAITNKGVVEVQSWFGTMEQESEGAGSGIVIAKNDTELLIATNNHVVQGAKELSVCVGDDEDQVYEALVKGTDVVNDLAVVAVNLNDIPTDVMEKITIAAMGDSESLKVGEEVVAIGNALGYGQSVTSGIVSALDRKITMDNMATSLIQTDAAINPGNSGGALFNMRGEVVGINSAKFASEEIEGMGYAIPISMAQPILSELESREIRDVVDEDKQGRLGISVMTVSSEFAQGYNLPLGVYVTGVDSGSAADKAGILQADIIVKFDGITVQSANDLVDKLTYYSAGETVDVQVMRMENGEYEEKTLSVTLQANTGNAENDKEQDQDDSAYQGRPDQGAGLPGYGRQRGSNDESSESAPEEGQSEEQQGGYGVPFDFGEFGGYIPFEIPGFGW